MKTTIIEKSVFESLDFKAPAKYYYINAFGDAVFIHVRSREDAEQYIVENYGKGFYKIRTSSLEKPSGDVTVRGTQTRRGQRK